MMIDLCLLCRFTIPKAIIEQDRVSSIHSILHKVVLVGIDLNVPIAKFPSVSYQNSIGIAKTHQLSKPIP
jgi:hypothetical protein